MPPVRAIIFDMDGVIVNSTRLHTEAWKQYLLRHGLETDGIESRMLGKHNDEIVRDFFGSQELNQEIIATHGANKERLYRQMAEPVFDSLLVPGIGELLSELRRFPLALATNAEPANVDFVLDRARIKQYFRVVVSAADVRRPKPCPDLYLRAAELLHIAPDSCIVFEDSLTGVAAARAAGMRVAGLLTTLATIAGVDLTVRDFRDPELRRWLASVLQPD